MSTLQIIGGGKMGMALVGGLIASGWADPGRLLVVEPVGDVRDQIAGDHPGLVTAAEPVDGVDALVAVKPWLVGEVLTSLTGVQRVLSIAAGVTISAMESDLPAGARVIRAMPNTPALVGLGASAIAAGSLATDDDMAWASALLGAVGVVEVVTEAQLDAVTGLSGSGPAYVFFLAEAMADAGVRAGLSRPTAERLAHQTIYGAGRMLMAADDDPGAPSATELRIAVTTPAGTTAEGVAALERGGVRAALSNAVASATERSRALGAS